MHDSQPQNMYEYICNSGVQESGPKRSLDSYPALPIIHINS